MYKTLRLNAAYNAWMNNSIYDTCRKLTDVERKAARGAFFKSIHGTLNHLLLTDLLWLSRINPATPLAKPVAELDEIIYEDFKDLERARKTTDELLLTFVNKLNLESLEKRVSYTSLQTKVEKNARLDLILIHLFNHQTHHRGQITTLLSQLGVDVGTTDLLFMPQAELILAGEAL